jgi:hypothetical protein
MSTRIHPKNVHEKSPKTCPRKVTQKEDFSWTLLSTRCHQKCPREVTPFVHKKSPIMSTRCLPPLSKPHFRNRSRYEFSKLSMQFFKFEPEILICLQLVPKLIKNQSANIWKLFEFFDFVA